MIKSAEIKIRNEVQQFTISHSVTEKINRENVDEGRPMRQQIVTNTIQEERKYIKEGRDEQQKGQQQRFRVKQCYVTLILQNIGLGQFLVKDF